MAPRTGVRPAPSAIARLALTTDRGPSVGREAMTLAIPALHRVPAAERGITIGDFLIPIRFGEQISPRLRDIALVLAGAMLISLSSLVRIPVPGSPVPITGQTFAVLLVGGALGYRRGTLATLGYLLIGFFLPV